jgi:hypothetical protein
MGGKIPQNLEESSLTGADVWPSRSIVAPAIGDILIARGFCSRPLRKARDR